MFAVCLSTLQPFQRSQNIYFQYGTSFYGRSTLFQSCSVYTTSKLLFHNCCNYSPPCAHSYLRTVLQFNILVTEDLMFI